MKTFDAKKVNELANGLWHDILPALTELPHDIFTKKNKPCPSCGGTDRFKFDDKECRGTWFCSQCGGRDGRGGAGDGLSLVMRINGWTFPQAVNEVGKWLNAPESDFSKIPRYKAPKREKSEPEQSEWIPIDPQPEEELHLLKLPKVTLWNQTKNKSSKVEPKHLAIIRDHTGALKGAVVRFEVPDSKNPGKIKKLPSQVMYCANAKSGECKWVMRGIGQDRPLYGAETIGDAKGVIMVQGERKRDIVTQHIQKIPCVSIVGGDSSVASMDLSPLHGKTVMVWPDNDWDGAKNSGMRCAKRIGEMLKGFAKVKIVTPPGESKPSGWDLGDAFTTDGWTPQQVKDYMSANAVEYAGYESPEDEFLNYGEPEKEDEDSFCELQEPEKKKRNKNQYLEIDLSHADTRFPEHIRFLGYDATTNYYYSMARKQVLSYSASSHTKSCLIQLVPEEIWQSCFKESIGGESGQIKWSLDTALNYLNRKSEEAGHYDPRNVRKGGCWWDEKRVVMHLGNRLLVDGVPCGFVDFDTKYVYESRPAVHFEKKGPLLDGEAKFIAMVAKSIRWKTPSSAMLAVGWAVMAPICGLLGWRSHIWLTGSSGCGKSTILTEFIRPLLGGISISPSGSSTEAGIRQSLNGDALPVVIDEAESNDHKDREKIQKIIELACVSSCDSSSMVTRGTAGGHSMSFNIRSMFAFAAIMPAIKRAQDVNRIAVMELVRASEVSEEESNRHWRTLKNNLAHVDEAMGMRLVARTMAMIDVVVESVEILKTTTAKVMGTQRLGDTYGTLLAGWWVLQNDRAPTEEEAEELSNSLDVRAFTDEPSKGGEDADECISAILQGQIRAEIAGRQCNPTIGELVHRRLKTLNCDMDAPSDIEAADIKAILGRNGVAVELDYLVIANRSPLEKVLKETAYGSNWSASLKRLAGAKVHSKAVRFGPGVVSRVVQIPWESVPM